MANSYKIHYSEQSALEAQGGEEAPNYWPQDLL